MKFVDYITDCLKDKEFREVWEEENSDLDIYLFGKHPEEKFSIREALKLLNEIDDSDLEDIIKNKGIHPINRLSNSEIIFYENKKDCPVKDFLNNIENDKLKSKTLRNIAELSIKGSEARPPLSKYVSDGIFELRTKQSSGVTRIFYFFYAGNKIILTNGYIKKSQNLNEKEFEKAKRYRDIYLKHG